MSESVCVCVCVCVCVRQRMQYISEFSKVMGWVSTVPQTTQSILTMNLAARTGTVATSFSNTCSHPHNTHERMRRMGAEYQNFRSCDGATTLSNTCDPLASELCPTKHLTNNYSIMLVQVSTMTKLQNDLTASTRACEGAV